MKGRAARGGTSPPGWVFGAVAMARPAGPPARRTAGPALRGKWREADSPASPSRQPASDTPRRRRPSAPPPDPTTRLAGPAAPDLAHRPQWRETDSPASLSRQPSRARPGSPATVARNRQPSVTLSSAQPRPTWLTGHSGEKPTAQRHFVVSPVPGASRPPRSQSSPSGVQTSWPLIRFATSFVGRPQRCAGQSERHIPPPRQLAVPRWPISLPATPANANANPTGRNRPTAPRTGTPAPLRVGPYRSRPHPPTRMPTQPAAAARRHLAPPAPATMETCHSATPPIRRPHGPPAPSRSGAVRASNL